MKEKVQTTEVFNEYTRSFLESFVREHITRYHNLWIKHQTAIELNGQVFGMPDDGIYFPLDSRQVGISQQIVPEMEFRGFVLQKFIPAVEKMLIEQIEIPLPEFLADELAAVKYPLTSKGTILDAEGKRVPYRERVGKFPKKGGVIRVFSGRQVALKLKYGDAHGPTIHPSEFKLIPASFISDKYWYDGIYLK